jgi:hypothetical protein
MSFKRQSYAVDPNCKEHQDKYREMRLKFARVSPAMFMKFLDTGKETVSAGASSAMAFWVVPKRNFPKGLPPKLKSSEVDADAEYAPQDVDREHFYVIDQCIPREQLGKGVWTVTSFNSTTSKYTSATSRSGSRPSHGDEAATGAVELAPAAATGADDVLARRGTRRLRQHTSSGGDDDPEGLAAKKSRMVTDTLGTLKANIESAKDAGIWTSVNVLSNNSVLFWVEQTVGALEEMVRDAGSGDKNSTQRIVCKFTCYLLQLAQESDCYPAWNSFKGLLPKLLETGGGAIPQRTVDDAKLLEQLALTNPDADNEPVNVEGVSVLARAHFYNTKVYNSFICHRVQHSLKSARNAPDGQRRLDILSAWDGAQGLPTHLSNGIKQAMQMFDPKIKLSERIAFVLHGKLEKMAMDWDATGPMGTAALMCGEAPQMRNTTYEVFKEAAHAIYEADHLESMQNPLMSSAVALVGALAENHDALVAHCVGVRLGLPVDAALQEPKPEYFENIPKSDLKGVAVKVKDFFHKAADPPAWVAQLAAAWQAEAHARQGAKQAKAIEAEAAAAAATTEAPPAALAAAAGDATAPPAAAAAATGAEPVIWTIGQIVTVKFGSGNNPMNGKNAKITGVLASHCWVEFLEGSAQGTAKKIVKTNLTPAEPVAAPHGATVDTAVEPDATGADETLNDWEAAEGVFRGGRPRAATGACCAACLVAGSNRRLSRAWKTLCSGGSDNIGGR